VLLSPIGQFRICVVDSEGSDRLLQRLRAGEPAALEPASGQQANQHSTSVVRPQTEAHQIRLAAVWLIPARSAIERVLQCDALAG
jgi:hypothetical protein